MQKIPPFWRKFSRSLTKARVRAEGKARALKRLRMKAA